MARWNIFGALVLFSLSVSLAEGGLSLEFDANWSTTGAFVVRGIPSEDLVKFEEHLLASDEWFRVGVATDKALQPMAGQYEIANEALAFTPLFPWQPGLEYQAELDPRILKDQVKWSSHPKLTLREKIPALPDGEPTQVRAIYPTAAVLPANLLKFYLHFSAPMSRGGIYEHLELLQENDEAIELPFLELGEELWDRELCRLTLLLDPGRVKHGLKPHEEAGPVLVPGKTYTLRVLATMPDANGKPLGKSYDKRFRTVEADQHQPQVGEIRTEVPTTAMQDALKLVFPEPLDHALLQRVITIEDSAGSRLAGNVEIEAEETQWHFVPSEPWQPGRYAVIIEAILEDLAGNNFKRLFERDEDSASIIDSGDGRIEFELLP